MTFFACILFMMVYLLKSDNLIQTDTWWHIKAGEWMIQNYKIASVDVFSWTAPGTPWTAHEWLYDVVLAMFAKLGTPGVYILTALTVIACLTAVKKLYNLEGLGLIYIALGLSTIITARPHTFGILFFLLALIGLREIKKGLKPYWMPLMFCVWANMHGSVILGVGLMWLWVMLAFVPESQSHKPGPKKHMALMALVCTLVTLINPHGWILYKFSLWVSLNPDFKNILEWQPTPFNLPFLLILTITPIAVLVFKKKELATETAILMFITLTAMLTGHRFFPYFILTWAHLVDIPIKNWSKKMISLGLVLISVGGIYYNGLPPGQIQNCETNLSSAVDYIKDKDYKKLLNHYNYGGYLIYRDVPVFIDGRADMYGEVYTDHTNLVGMKKDPEKILEKYHPDAIMLPIEAPLSKYLKKVGWEESYTDNAVVILQRER